MGSASPVGPRSMIRAEPSALTVPTISPRRTGIDAPSREDLLMDLIEIELSW